jgi:hypothetical protein
MTGPLAAQREPTTGDNRGAVQCPPANENRINFCLKFQMLMTTTPEALQPPGLTPIKFQFFTLKFKPYAEHAAKETSATIIQAVITHLQRKLQDEHQGYLADRHENRAQEERREMYLQSAVFLARERRALCSMALLRKGRKPKLKPLDKFILVPLSELGDVAEETHFYIDYSGKAVVLCIEYNHYGTRALDIEWYLRTVAHDELKLAVSTELEAVFETPIAETLANLRSVLSFEVRMKPQNIPRMDNEIKGYYTAIANLDQRVHPKWVRLEASFSNPTGNFSEDHINREATGMVRNQLTVFQRNAQNIDCFDAFTFRYISNDGSEEVFKLMKGKKEVVKDVDLKKILKKRDYYTLIEREFNDFIQALNAR